MQLYDIQYTLNGLCHLKFHWFVLLSKLLAKCCEVQILLPGQLSYTKWQCWSHEDVSEADYFLIHVHIIKYIYISTGPHLYGTTIYCILYKVNSNWINLNWKVVADQWSNGLETLPANPNIQGSILGIISEFSETIVTIYCFSATSAGGNALVHPRKSVMNTQPFFSSLQSSRDLSLIIFSISKTSTCLSDLSSGSPVRCVRQVFENN